MNSSMVGKSRATFGQHVLQNGVKNSSKSGKPNGAPRDARMPTISKCREPGSMSLRPHYGISPTKVAGATAQQEQEATRLQGNQESRYTRRATRVRETSTANGSHINRPPASSTADIRSSASVRASTNTGVATNTVPDLLNTSRAPEACGRADSSSHATDSKDRTQAFNDLKAITG